ncbi:MAG: GAF domain-containing protein [Candidatus Aquicultor sp.]|nr:GAF domain-containing protein [Candidatus Aquicultor sp.]
MSKDSETLKELERELKRFKKLFAEAFDAIIVFGLDGTIVDSNGYASELTGYTRDELLQMDAFGLRPQSERAKVRKILDMLIEEGHVRNFSETHFKKKDGTLIPVEINAKVIKVNRRSFILSIARDITERLQIEEELREGKDNLELLNKVALEITSRLDFREILTRVVENAVKSMGGNAGAIGFYDEHDGTVSFPYVYNMPRNLEKAIIGRGDGLSGHVIETREPVIIDDYPNHELAVKEFVEAGVKSAALVVLESKETVLGVLGVFAIEPESRLLREGLGLLVGIGRQAAAAIENARLFEQAKDSEARLRDQNRNLQILARTALEITSGLKLDKFLPLIVRRAVQLSNADAGAVGFYDEESDTLTYSHAYRFPGSLSKAVIHSGVGVTGDVIKTKRPSLVNECLPNAATSVEFADCGVKALIVVPLLVDERLIGSLLVGNLSEARKFSGNDLTMVEAVGRQAAIAIENSRLFAETEERARRSEAANEISRIISSTLELSEVLHRVINETSNAIGIEAGGIFFYQPDEGRFYGQMGYGPVGEHIHDIVEDASKFRFAAEAIKTKEYVLIKDANIDPRVPYNYVRMFGLRSVLVLPLAVKDKVSGVIILSHTDAEHKFDEDQIAFAGSIALQAAIAIENARLFDKSRQSAKEAGLLLEASETLTSALNINDVLQRLGIVATELTGLKRGSIQFYDPESQVIEFVASIGRPNFAVGTRVLLAEMGNMLASMYVEMRTVVIDDLQTETLLGGLVADLDMMSLLGVPIVERNEIIGGLFLDNPGASPAFTSTQIRLAEAIAREAALAISNARLYEKIKDAYERERYVADVLQRSFLPGSLPQIPNTELAVYYASASEAAKIGGDFYDFIDISDSLIGLVMGDVSGKGIEAASTTALAKYTMRSFAYQTKHASGAVEMANRVISRDIETGTFITLVYAVYDWHSGRLLISNAGHPHPIHYSGTLRRARQIENFNAAFGVLPDLAYTETVERLSDDDFLVFYTDGVIEARQGSEFYGVERLLRAIEVHAELSAEELVGRVIEEVTLFARGRLTDDIALSILRRKSTK